MNWLTNLNLSGNELQNAVIQNLSTAPTNPKVGMVYYNTDKNRYFGYNGTSWVAMDSKDVDDVTVAALFNAGAPVAAIYDNQQFAVIHNDSAGSKTTYSFWSDMKSNLKSYFDTLYNKYVHPNHTGDVTSTGDGATVIGTGKVTTDKIADSGITTIKIANNAVTNAKSADMAVNTIKGRVTTGTGDPEDLTAAQVRTIINVEDGANKYVHPASHLISEVSGLQTALNSKANTSSLHSHSNYGVIETYDQANDDIKDAVVKKHAQNTDTGTNSSRFSIGGNGGIPPVYLHNNNGNLEILDLTNENPASLTVYNMSVEGDLRVTGTTTTVNSTTVEIGDNEIELNSGVSASSQNSDGGITIKRLKSDNTTRADARITFNNLTGKWQTTSGSINGNIVTTQIASKMSFEIGNGKDKEYILIHNLGTKDLAVSIRETYPQDGYQLVYTDVRFIDDDRIKVIFANAPATNQYKVTIVG